jgi:peptidoglycan/LPS O-acetylase OafA/YrhL
LQFCAAIAATFGAAALLSALIERPGIGFGRKLGHWLLARAPASPAIPLLRGVGGAADGPSP